MRRLAIAAPALIIAVAALVVSPSAASAFTVDTELTLGYDDNPGALPEGEGSFFAGAGLTGIHSVATGKTNTVELELQAGGQAYEGGRASVRIGAGATYRWSAPRAETALSAGAVLVRNDLFPEEARNETVLGGAVDWFARRNVVLSARNTWTMSDYLHGQRIPVFPEPMMPPPGPIYLATGSPTGSMGRMGPMPDGHDPGGLDGIPMPGRNPVLFTDENRTDVTGVVGIDLSVSATDGIGLSASLEGGRRWSSLDTEDSRFLRAAIGAAWTPEPLWSVAAEVGSTRNRFDQEVDGRERTDRVHDATVEIARTVGTARMFAGVQWREYNSPVPVESYERMVTQCGVTFIVR